MGEFVYWFGGSLPFFLYIYIFFPPFFLFVNVHVYASLCNFCLYSFAFTICPKVLPVHFFVSVFIYLFSFFLSSEPCG